MVVFIEEALYSHLELAELLGVSTKTLERGRAAFEVGRFEAPYAIPFVRTGRDIRYHSKDVKNYFELLRVTAETVSKAQDSARRELIKDLNRRGRA